MSVCYLDVSFVVREDHFRVWLFITAKLREHNIDYEVIDSFGALMDEGGDGNAISRLLRTWELSEKSIKFLTSNLYTNHKVVLKIVTPLSLSRNVFSELMTFFATLSIQDLKWFISSQEINIENFELTEWTGAEKVTDALQTIKLTSEEEFLGKVTAASYGWRELICEDEIVAIIEEVGSIDIVDESGETPLLKIVKSSSLKREKRPDFLWFPKSEIKKADEADQKYRSSVKALLRAGADPVLKNKLGECCLSVAAQYDNKDLFILLWGSSNKDNLVLGKTLWNALSVANKTIIEAISEYVTFPNQALFLVCASEEWSEGKLDLVKYLIEECKLEPDETLEQSLEVRRGFLHQRATPLMAAVLADDPDVVSYLISKGADVSVKDAQGYSALHYASGAVWTVEDSKETFRCGMKNDDVLKILLDEGINPFEVSKTGQTCHDLATEEQNSDALYMIESWAEENGIVID